MPIRLRRYDSSPEFFRATTPTLVLDDFERTVTNGLGSAPMGGAWTVETGDASSFQASGGTGRIVVAGSSSSAEASLLTPSYTDIDLLMTFSISRAPVGAGIGPSLRARFREAPGWYSYGLRLIFNDDLTVTYILERTTDDTTSTLKVGVLPDVRAAANRSYNMRFQCFNTSPTTVRGRAWYADSYEPSTWADSTTDSTAGNQTAGGVFIRCRNGTGYSGEPVSYTIERLIGIDA